MKNAIKKIIDYFTLGEIILFFSTIISITVFYFLFDGQNHLTFIASIIGATSLIFNAKGNPIGQALMIVFSILYGIISYSFSYYGEMITYLLMTMPMAAFSLISWLKNPFNGKSSEVEVNSLSKKEYAFMFAISLIVTFAFYFILKYFNTANLLPSTISVTTSFIGVYLTFRRSPYYALGYAANDVVLIILWILASIENISYISVVVCFVAFLVNDLYGFFAWKKLHGRQKKLKETSFEKSGV